MSRGRGRKVVLTLHCCCICHGVEVEKTFHCTNFPKILNILSHFEYLKCSILQDIVIIRQNDKTAISNEKNDFKARLHCRKWILAIMTIATNKYRNSRPFSLFIFNPSVFYVLYAAIALLLLDLLRCNGFFENCTGKTNNGNRIIMEELKASVNEGKAAKLRALDWPSSVTYKQKPGAIRYR